MGGPSPARLVERSRGVKLAVWHFDHYPTAPGVYLDCFPRMGHEVVWVTSTEGERNEIAERGEGSVRRIEVRRRRDSAWPRPLGTLVNRWNKLVGFFMKARLMRRLARDHPDVLQVRDLITEGLLAAFFARLSGVPFTFQMDHPHPEGRLLELDREGKGSRVERLVQRAWIHLRGWVLGAAAAVFPISFAMAEWLRDRHGVDPRRLVPFPVGVSRATFDAGETPLLHSLARSLATHPTVCYLGNLHARRDPEFLFEVLSRIAAEMPEARFLVIGELTREAERARRAFGAGDRLVVTGHVPHGEVPSLLRAARVGIFPIPVDDPYQVYRTSSPLKVVEYLSAGLPVVSSRVGDAERLLEESGAGICVDNEAARFARATLSYLRDPERARRDGARGRDHVRAHRLFEVLALEVEGAYRRLLATGLPATPESPLIRRPPRSETASRPAMG